MKLVVRLLTCCFVLFTSLDAEGQALPPLQPEQDPCNAIPLCGGAFVTPYSYSGFGFGWQQTQASGACHDENDSVWFKLTVATAGNIVFNITPFSNADDYDFAVYNITSSTCSTGITNANRIRCNGNTIIGSASSVVGLNYTSTTFVTPAGALNQNFNQYIAASVGDVYIILVDNFNASSNGFTLDLTGSTATFLGDGPPEYDSIRTSNACNTSTGLKVKMDQPVRCNSIAANGSDFSIVPALATVTSAVGTGCVANGYTNEITLTFSSPLPSGTYTLQAQTGTDGNTLLDLCPELQLVTDSILFNVRAPLVVNAGRDTVLCPGGSTQLVGTYAGGGTAQSVLWTPATGLSSTTILTPTASPTGATQTYTLTVTPDGLAACAVSDVVTVGVLQGFNITTPATTLCRGQSVTIATTGDPRYTYTWTPPTGLSTTTAPGTVATPDTTTTYTLTATYPTCPASSQFFTITVEPVPTVDAGRDTVLCYFDVLQMNPTVTPPFNAYTYSWTPDSVFDFPTALTPRFTAYDTVTATLTVTTPNGCTGKDSLVLTVVPRLFSEVSADTGICPRDSAQLLSSGAMRYQWSPPYGLSSDTVAAPMASPVTNTLYTVVTTNALGCRDTQRVEVTVYPGAVVELPDSVRLHPGEEARLNPAGNCLYFRWFPPYGLSADSIANPVATPGVNTRYFVSATTEWGCAARDSIDVFVDPDTWIDVPNAFTPGSAPNGFFRPSRRGLATIYSFRVFNRWGQKVYETSTLDAGWDGRYNGEPQPLGVYIWELDATTQNGKRMKKQGNVTLLR